MRIRFRHILLLALMIGGNFVLLAAQSTGSVKGIVKDTTGAILPGATATLMNKGTRAANQMLTTEAGAFSFTFILPGAYSISIDLPGFKRMIRDNVIVNVAETVSVDLVLEVGELTQEITVSGEAPLVQATTSALGHAVEQVMVTGVPLSSRNYTQILALSPGVVASVPDAGAIGRNSVNISSSGARPYQNSVVFNGLVADNPMSGGFDDQSDKTGPPIPAPDAIQEYKVQTALYDAEFGRMSGSNINLITKTGTNEWHGALFEFLRNDALNANSFFRNQSGLPKGVLKQNQFGMTLGGPIVTDKTFFFVAYQATIQRNGVSSVSALNTFLPPLTSDRSARALGAKFGGQRGVRGGTAVAADGSNINPVALALLNAKLPNGQFAIPDPQIILRNGSGFSAFAETARFHENQTVMNLDHTFEGGDRLSVKTFLSFFPATVPFSISSNIPGFGEQWKKSNMNFAISETHAFSPTFFNEFRIGYNRNRSLTIPIEPVRAADVGMISPVRPFDKTPLISVTGAFVFGPDNNTSNLTLIHGYEVADTMSLVKGRHSVKFGGNVNPFLVTRNNVFLTRGSIAFLSFPDFLLGMSGPQNGTAFSNVSVSQVSNGLYKRHPRFRNFGAFVQDDIRVNSRLTLNAGLRWQFNGNQEDKRGRNGAFFRSLAPQGVIPPPEGWFAGMVIPGNSDGYYKVNLPPTFTKLARKTFSYDNYLGFSPRVGLAYRPIASMENFVMRAGYGIYWSYIEGSRVETTSFDPWYVQRNAGSNDLAIATFQNPFPQGIPQVEEFPYYAPWTLGSNPILRGFDPTMRQPYTQQWSLNLQQGFGSYVFEVGYVGSGSIHLNTSYKANQALLASQEHPVNGQTTNTVANVALRAPIIGLLPNGYSEQGSYGRSHYHSLQLSLNKRYANGLSFTTAYTFGQSIDNIAAGLSGRGIGGGGFIGDFYNRNAYNRGPSNFDRKHRLAVSYLYQIPKLETANGLAKAALNGWILSGVVTLQTGLPFSITDTTAATIYGTSANSYAQFAPGKSASDVRKSGRTEDRLNQYFDTAQFTRAPAIGDGTGFGNAGRNILRGPGQTNLDMSLGRTFPTGKENRKIEFRSEFFNILNHPQFGNPAGEYSTATTFGAISTTVVGPRIIQFALKYTY